MRKSQSTQTYAKVPQLRARALLIEAMVDHRLGQSEPALQALAQASQLIGEHLPKFATGQIGSGWHDWLIAEILRREAAKLIQGPTEVSTPEAKSEATPKTE